MAKQPALRQNGMGSGVFREYTGELNVDIADGSLECREGNPGADGVGLAVRVAPDGGLTVTDDGVAVEVFDGATVEVDPAGPLVDGPRGLNMRGLIAPREGVNGADLPQLINVPDVGPRLPSLGRPHLVARRFSASTIVELDAGRTVIVFDSGPGSDNPVTFRNVDPMAAAVGVVEWSARWVGVGTGKAWVAELGVERFLNGRRIVGGNLTKRYAVPNKSVVDIEAHGTLRLVVPPGEVVSFGAVVTIANDGGGAGTIATSQVAGEIRWSSGFGGY